MATSTMFKAFGLLLSILAIAINANADPVTPTQPLPTAADFPATTIPYAQATLDAASYTYAFTYTTPTNRWKVPAFPTASPVPLPSCSETMCPALNKKSCTDSQGTIYGVLCNTRFGGTVITSAGKHRMLEKSRKEKRGYTGTLDNCLGFCDMYHETMCKGADYVDGFCHYYALISGTIATPGEVALVRQS